MTILGFLCVAVIPHLFIPEDFVVNGSLPGVIIDVGWAAAITGGVMGLGLGLFVGSFFQSKKEEASPTESARRD